ncbi:hypothetical protein ABV23_RS00200 [Escherichia coli]|nr:hypothetical protein [Escherichia coli]
MTYDEIISFANKLSTLTKLTEVVLQDERILSRSELIVSQNDSITYMSFRSSGRTIIKFGSVPETNGKLSMCTHNNGELYGLVYRKDSTVLNTFNAGASAVDVTSLSDVDKHIDLPHLEINEESVFQLSTVYNDIEVFGISLWNILRLRDDAPVFVYANYEDIDTCIDEMERRIDQFKQNFHI